MARKKKYEDEEDEDEEEEEEDDEDEDEEDEEDEDDSSDEEEEQKEQPKPAKKVIPGKKEEGNWKHFSQPEFVGFQNKDGEVITHQEAIRRILNYAEESAKNTR